MTWGEFKRCIERQLADGNGDDEEVRSIDWNGPEDPVVAFKTVRHGRETLNLVYVR